MYDGCKYLFKDDSLTNVFWSERFIMDEKLISVVIPTYNRSVLLKRAIDSLLSQAYKNIEIIVVDDASSDDTESVVRNYLLQCDNIRYYRNEENKGANYSRNYGALMSNGEYLSFFDSDNVRNENGLMDLAMELDRSGDDVQFVFGRVIRFIGNESVVFPEEDFECTDLHESLMIHNVIDTNAALIRRTYFIESGGFDSDLPRFQDWDLFYRLIERSNQSGKFVDTIVAKNYVNEDSISNDFSKLVESYFYLGNKYGTIFWTNQFLLGCLAEKFIVDEKFQKKLYDKLRNYPELYVTFLKALTDAIARKQKYIQHVENINLFLQKWDMDEFVEPVLKKVIDKGISNVAIYGAGFIGSLIYSRSINCGLKVEYVVDRKVSTFFDCQVFRPDEMLPDTELMIVSPYYEYEMIKNSLYKKYRGRIVSIEKIVFSSNGDWSVDWL